MPLRPSDLKTEVTEAVALAAAMPPVDDLEEARRKRAANRRTEALALRMAGMTFEQIGERLSITADSAVELINRTISRVGNQVAEEMRELEGARLDRSQAAIWSKVLEGDLHAVDSFLKISARRSKLFGLDAPTQLNISYNVRQEMEQALANLERTVLGQSVVVSDVPYPSQDEAADYGDYHQV
jgi:hypothetical protein